VEHSTPPLIVLGVRRSGTTLLRVMLDRSSQLAVPDESYFIPQLAERHRGGVDVEDFVEDLRRIPTLREWEVDPGKVRERLRPGMPVGEAVGAVFATYAADRGKARWGDKTPMYMQYLPLLERLFPDALYVHLVRDGRDAAASYLQMPSGIVTESWGHPTSAAGFGCQWGTEVKAARALGRRVGPARYHELRYEQLVESPEDVLEAVCSFAALPWEPDMLGYAQEVDVSARPHQQSLKRPPTSGLRNWRTELGAGDVAGFEDVAGDVLAELGYELADRSRSAGPSPRGRAKLAAYRTQTWAWRSAGSLVRRSPFWTRRHPPLA
jgi:Sulfotransferase family